MIPNSPNSPDDPDNKDQMVVVAHMDPLMKLAEILGRALVDCYDSGTLSKKQINEFWKALNRAKASLENDLLDLQLDFQRRVDAGEFDDKLTGSPSFHTEEVPLQSVRLGNGDADANDDPLPNKPTHITTKKAQ